jgi:hypothetical protein
VSKAVSGFALLVAVAALAVAVAAFREAREVPTQAEITEAAVETFLQSGNQMTPAQVLRLLGKPHEVFRNNPRALCWRYSAPYEIRMCWGPKRRQAWIAVSGFRPEHLG